MTDRQALIDDLIRDEDIRLFPYVDTTGNVTIGVGHNLTAKGIKHRMAMWLLEQDLDETIADCSLFAWFPDLDAVRQRVVVNMCFNLGLARFRAFTETIAAIERRDYAVAAEQMRQSKWAGQVKGRAVRLAAMMATGCDPAPAVQKETS